MKFLPPGMFISPFRRKAESISGTNGNPTTKPPAFFSWLKWAFIPEQIGSLGNRSLLFLDDIKSIGTTKDMDDYERRKLSIFNQINFFQLLTGILLPLSCLWGAEKFSIADSFIATLPAMVSFLVLCLNVLYRYEAGMIAYFSLYPVVSGLIYLSKMDLGIELNFILFGVLAVFFLREFSYMLFSLVLSMVSYFMVAVVCKNYTYQLEKSNFYFYLFNQLVSLVFIVYALFLIKKENAGYHDSLIARGHDLFLQNREIQEQKTEIGEKAKQLEQQTVELSELNSLKNKLFSVIAHDLKSPIFALRNLFRNIQQYDLPVQEVRKMIPQVVHDLNYTTGLLENLLQWAKSQMQSGSFPKQEIDLSRTVKDCIGALQLQADTKKIHLENAFEDSVWIVTDKEMAELVLRNLISNALKFTPEGGRIRVDYIQTDSFVEVSVKDSGMGISAEALEKINQNNYFNTQGTARESGTGLGLMLCKEFLARNGAALQVSSEISKGSTFSFRIPR
jgi:signal transduction histidine kinase